MLHLEYDSPLKYPALLSIVMNPDIAKALNMEETSKAAMRDAQLAYDIAVKRLGSSARGAKAAMEAANNRLMAATADCELVKQTTLSVKLLHKNKWLTRMRRVKRAFSKKKYQTYYHSFHGKFMPIFRLNALLNCVDDRLPILPRLRLSDDVVTIDDLKKIGRMSDDHEVAFRRNGIAVTTSVDRPGEACLDRFFMTGYKGGATVEKVSDIMHRCLEDAGKRATINHVMHLEEMLTQPGDVAGGHVLVMHVRNDVVNDIVYASVEMGKPIELLDPQQARILADPKILSDTDKVILYHIPALGTTHNKRPGMRGTFDYAPARAYIDSLPSL